ncbi:MULTISPECIES: hypothetical protein [Vibrio]|uniref:hypothetical protein n=1 Tax=Vibrio TaxID=662 RepID=UPI00076AFE19|nr:MULTISPECIES: hypothetical protein [Vibrio]EHD2271104.1 hypothetical protein [Vibrio cholerae]EHY0954976.1 hypothetical protein [Vibrio cholerae]EIC2299410.1 hypothetical protein [Vibrio cholerae]EIJ2221323.1 hypothetical protein [Vibrio cholerae]EJL6633869.1 hypothetical protein [Vibrio cholerae]
MRYIYTLILSILSFSAVSGSEVDAWYTSKGGDYLVKDSIHGVTYGLIGVSKAGDMTVYFQFWEEECSSLLGDGVQAHDPIKVNGQLVRMLQSCDGKWRTIFAASDKGRDYIINQFKKKNFVELKGYDDSYKLLFSAKNFTKLFNLKVSSSAAI